MDYQGKTVVWGKLALDKVGDHWVLRKKYEVRIGTKIRLTCPAGLETDGASIPRFFWRLIGHPMMPVYVEAAVIHDAGYVNKLEWCRKNGGWLVEEHTRKEVDDLFLHLMEALGLSWWRRRMMYLAVRWFGGGHWTEG